jgi:ferric-dicitrate binding protein FerR (iron transport regulator)
MDDLDLEKVLKAAGPREKPPADVERAVREHLRREWRAAIAEQGQRSRQRTGFALAAGLLAAAIGVWAIAPRFAEAPVVVASVTFAADGVRMTSGWLDRWHAVAPGQAVVAGQTIETGPSGRGAFALAGGVAARIDRDSRLLVAGAERLVLERGTIYVDSGAGSAVAAPLEVVTPSGTVSHVGTQYEVRLLDAGVRVSVRDGMVEWRSGDGQVERTTSGEQLTITPDGRVERALVSAYGPLWDWTLEASPAIDIEGMPLSRFLAWAARETGRQVRYASPEVERDVAGIIVHGSIAGLTPPEALHAILETTSVRAQASGESLVVDDRPLDTP